MLAEGHSREARNPESPVMSSQSLILATNFFFSQLSFPLPPVPGNPHFISVSMNLTTLDTSYTWTHGVFVFL